jgi:uncharacterized membrane-anchored protein YjiN (DUF445 family)
MDEMLDTFDLGAEGLDDIGESMGTDYSDGEPQYDSDAFDVAESAVFAAAALQDLASSAEINELAASTEAMDDISDMMGIAMERTIVKLDRNARFKHLRKAITLHLARKEMHPKYKKLLTIWKMERALEGDLDKIYRNKATQLAKQQIKNYAANGVKRIPKAYPETAVGKGKPSTAVAQRA